MVQVCTDNGIFNITKDLYEAIKINHPVLLEDKNTTIHYEPLILPKLRKYGFTNVKQITPMLNQIAEIKPEILSDINKTTNVIIKGIENKRNKDKEKKADSDVEKNTTSEKEQVLQQITDNQAERHDGNISSDMFSQVSPEKKEEIEKNNQINKNDENNQNNQPTKAGFKNIDEKNKLKYMVENDYELHQQISSIEALSTQIIKRIKYILHSQAGIMGSHTQSTSSQFPELSQEEKDLFTDTNADPNKKVNHTMTNKHVDKMDDNSSSFRRGASELKLAFGGFKFKPYFGDLNSSISGKALKYYASAQKDTDNSRIDDMIKTLLVLKTNPEKFDKEDLNNYKKPFEQMAYRFLHNVVYSLIINNETQYDEMLRIIRNDNVLKDMFNVSYLNIQQQLNARENIMYFENIENKTIDLLLIVSPLLAKGRKIINNLKPLWDLHKQVKV